MKKIIFIIAVLLSGVIFGAQADRLSVYSKYNGEVVRLKWIPQNYSSKNVYKIYRKSTKEKRKLIAIIKPVSYEKLKDSGYSEEDLIFIYPHKIIKNKIEAYVQSKKMGGFRILKMMRNNEFSKDIGQYFEDKSINKNTKYTYEVTLLNGTKKVSSKSVKIDTSKKSLSGGVFFVRSKNKSSGVGLKWGSGNSFSFYNVYRKKEKEKEFKKINRKSLYISPSYAKKAKEFYEDKNLVKGESAIYHIRKLDMFAEEGKPSYNVKGKRLLIKEIPTVKSIFVKNSDTKIIIRWKKIPEILGYNIYKSTNYNGGYRKLNKELIKKEVFFDKKFKTDQNYYYYVTAINKNGESKPSTKMLSYAKDVTAPSFPKKLNYEVSAGVVNLKWQGVQDKDLLGYRVYMSMDKNATQWIRVTKKEINGTSYMHKRPKTLSRNFYFYHVRAVDNSFNESARSNIIKIKLPDVTPPKQPVVTRTLAYTNKIFLEWGKVIVYDLDHYNVYNKNGKKLNKNPLIRNVFIDKNPSLGINSYIITAVDEAGNESIRKEMVKIKLLDNTAVKIENFKVQKIKKGYKISFTCKDVDYNGFEVFRSIGKDLKYYNISSFQKAKSFIDKNVAKGGTYFYMIKAYDKSGNTRESEVQSVRVEKK